MIIMEYPNTEYLINEFDFMVVYYYRHYNLESSSDGIEFEHDSEDDETSNSKSVCTQISLFKE